MISHILCWDIDGTLLSTGGGGIPAWESSFEEIFGLTIDFRSLETAGLTDIEIATLLANECQKVSSNNISSLVRRYESRLLEALPSQKGHVMPGVIEILTQLQTMPWVHSMLLTGNTKKGAQTKLAYYGLSQFFKDGAFSDGLPDRASVARLALEQIKSLPNLQSDITVYVIGDTPSDILCGKAINATTVSVCTGKYNRSSLLKFDPDMIFDSLLDATVFFDMLNIEQLNSYAEN